MTITHVGPYADSADREATKKALEYLLPHVEKLRLYYADAVALNVLITLWMNLSLQSFGEGQTRKTIADLPGSFEEGLLSLKDGV